MALPTARLLPLLAVSLGLLGCKGEPDERVLQTELPRTAPAVVLLAMQEGDRDITIEGTVQAELYVDLDTAEDERHAFRYIIEDASGADLYQRSFPSPEIVYSYLEHYGDAAGGYNVLELYPQLGAFHIILPLLEGAEQVRFELRDEDGAYHEHGRYSLSAVEGDDVGLSDVVEGWETLHDSGPSEQRLDIVIVGDGFTAEEQDLWREQADALAQGLLEMGPLEPYRDLVNIHRVDAVSNETGVSFGCPECSWVDNAFGSVLPLEIINRFMGTNYSTRALIQEHQWEVARAVGVVPFDHVLIVANTQQGSGMAVHFATLSTSGDYVGTGVHEFGHLLGLVGDEYVYDDCIISERLGLPPNIAADPEDPPWAHWLAEGTPLPTTNADSQEYPIGAYEGAYNCDDLYRPARNCIMKGGQSHDAFCAPCTEAIVTELFRYVDPVDSVSLVDGELVLEGPLDDVIVEVYEDGELVAEGTAGSPPELPEGELELRLRVPADEVLLDEHGDLEEVLTVVSPG